MENRKNELSNILNQKWFDDTSQAWNSKSTRKLLAEEYEEWIPSLADWKVFITLTFREDRHPDVAKSLFKKLVTHLNKDVFGRRYTRIVGHSYFSYVLAIEYQLREVIHFHVLTDQPIHYRLVHQLWKAWAGFAWIDTIENKANVIGYVSKYVIKGGEIIPDIAKKRFIPNTFPYWWNETRKEVSERERQLSLV